MIGRLGALVGVAAMACGSAGERDPSLTGNPTSIGSSTVSPSASSSGEGSGETTTESSGAGDEDSTSGEVRFDLGAETGGCDVADVCCLNEGELPPHALLDAFLAAYPPAAMPANVAAIQAFAPVADGHAMAWSSENVGDEFIDPNAGGVIDANIAAGRALARHSAELALPADATIVATREDPPVITMLPGPGVCNGVGWAWGSLLVERADLSIAEVVYLYVGMCADRDQNDDPEDIEVFFYSDESVEICAPPG